MPTVLGEIVSSDGTAAAEAKAVSAMGVLPQLLQLFMGLRVSSAEVIRYPRIRLTLERDEDKQALLKQRTITVFDIQVRSGSFLLQNACALCSVPFRFPICIFRHRRGFRAGKTAYDCVEDVVVVLCMRFFAFVVCSCGVLHA